MYPWEETKIFFHTGVLFDKVFSLQAKTRDVLLNDPWDNREASKPWSIRTTEPDPNTFRMNRGFPALSTHWKSSLRTARCTSGAETQTKSKQYKFNTFLLIFVEKYNLSHLLQNVKPKESTLTLGFSSQKIQQIPFLVIRLSSWAKNIYECFNIFMLCKGKTLDCWVKHILYCGFNQISLHM